MLLSFVWKIVESPLIGLDVLSYPFGYCSGWNSLNLAVVALEGAPAERRFIFRWEEAPSGIFSSNLTSLAVDGRLCEAETERCASLIFWWLRAVFGLLEIFWLAFSAIGWDSNWAFSWICWWGDSSGSSSQNRFFRFDWLRGVSFITLCWMPLFSLKIR